MRAVTTDFTTIRQTDRLSFTQFAKEVARHPACQHPMFKRVKELAEHGQLTADQIDLFTRTMMARIFRTIPSIAGLVESAMEQGDVITAQTAMQNLTEEMEAKAPHYQLAEAAFNALRAGFKLPRITLKEAYEHVPIPASYLQDSVWRRAYHEFPAIASWLQERASGGASQEQLGMMADIFSVFRASRQQIGNEAFKRDVLPYFRAHNTVIEQEGDYRIQFTASSVEYQHGMRAQRDALRNYSALPVAQRRRVEHMAYAFLDAQDTLFSNIQKTIETPELLARYRMGAGINR